MSWGAVLSWDGQGRHTLPLGYELDNSHPLRPSLPSLPGPWAEKHVSLPRNWCLFSEWLPKSLRRGMALAWLQTLA